MNVTKPADYIVSEAKRTQLTKNFLDIVKRSSFYYRQFLQNHFDKRALTALAATKATDPKKAKEIDAILRGSKPTATADEFMKFAEWIANRFIPHALGRSEEQPKLELPVEIIEQVSSGALNFYRAFGGEAKPIGAWWMAQDQLQEIMESSPVRNAQGRDRQEAVRTFMLSSSFVHPRWNLGKHVARLTVPAGMRVPIVVGMGSWRTTSADHRADSGKTAGENLKRGQAARKGWGWGEGDDAKDAYRILRLGMLPRTGPKQWYLPVFDQGWVHEIADNDPQWPFGA